MMTYKKNGNFYFEILDYLKAPNKESLDMSLDNVHARGLFSLVISGTEPGKLTRVFVAQEKMKPFQAQLHSHRYPIKLAVIKGSVRQHVARESNSPNSILMDKYEYRSPLNGGLGLSSVGTTNVELADYVVPTGAVLTMQPNEIHTISCSKGSIWIVQEQGFEVEKSIVLGVPFVVDGLYATPEMFKINDVHTLVLRAMTKIVDDFQFVSGSTT